MTDRLTPKQLRHVANHGTNLSRSKAVALQLIDCMGKLERAEQATEDIRHDFDQYVAITEDLLGTAPVEPEPAPVEEPDKVKHITYPELFPDWLEHDTVIETRDYPDKQVTTTYKWLLAEWTIMAIATTDV